MARHVTDRRREPSKALRRKVQDSLDSALEDSFPASDPVSFLQAVPVKSGDEALSTVKINRATATRRAGRRAR